MSKQYLRYHKKARIGIVLTVLTVLLLAMIFIVGDIVEGLLERRGNDGLEDMDFSDYGYGNTPTPTYYLNGAWYARKKNVDIVLLIGVDKYVNGLETEGIYRNTEQSDFALVLVLDHNAECISALQINRDAMVNIRELDLKGNPVSTFSGQLALSHTYGSGKKDSCENVIYSVSDYLYGVKIDHYISFGMDAVPVLNDSVGGVTLTVLDDLTPLDATLIKGEEITLLGDHALNYIRARGSLANSTNIERMKRQRQYISAFLSLAQKKLLTDSEFAFNAITDFSSYTVTDYTLNQMVDLLNRVKGYSFDSIRTVDGEARVGSTYMEFYTDEEDLLSAVLELFFEPADK